MIPKHKGKRHTCFSWIHLDRKLMYNDFNSFIFTTTHCASVLRTGADSEKAEKRLGKKKKPKKKERLEEEAEELRCSG